MPDFSCSTFSWQGQETMNLRLCCDNDSPWNIVLQKQLRLGENGRHCAHPGCSPPNPTALHLHPTHTYPVHTYVFQSALHPGSLRKTVVCSEGATAAAALPLSLRRTGRHLEMEAFMWNGGGGAGGTTVILALRGTHFYRQWA